MAAPPADVVRLALDGEVDLANLARARTMLLDAARARPGCTILLDMSRVTFLDSSGIGMLVGVHKEMQAADGALRVVAPHPRVDAVLKLTGLAGILMDLPADIDD